MSQIDTILSAGKYSMFHPTSRGEMLLDYPDMRTVKSFTVIDNPRKMLFVWFYANKCSRAREFPDDSTRIQFALQAAWGGRAPKEILRDYPLKKWGALMDAAIEDMRAYEPLPRILLKLQCMQAIENVNSILNVDVKSLPSWEERLKFIKATEAGLELVMKLQPFTEQHALGVGEKNVDQEEEEGAIMERLHNELNT